MTALPGWARPVLDAAGLPELGAWAVVVWPDGGTTWRAGVYSSAAVAQGQATRRSRDGRTYLVKRHRAGIAVYSDVSTVLGSVMM